MPSGVVVPPQAPGRRVVSWGIPSVVLGMLGTPSSGLIWLLGLRSHSAVFELLLRRALSVEGESVEVDEVSGP